MTRILKSFRLTPAAVTSLGRLADHLALSRSRILELLIVGEITPSRITPDDLCRRRPPTRVQEIRELVRLARILGFICRDGRAPATDEPSLRDLKDLIQRIYGLIERLDMEQKPPVQEAAPKREDTWPDIRPSGRGP